MLLLATGNWMMKVSHPCLLRESKRQNDMCFVCACRGDVQHQGISIVFDTEHLNACTHAATYRT
eukprot:1147437-Pelagomonas_calceolata.AAC.3